MGLKVNAGIAKMRAAVDPPRRMPPQRRAPLKRKLEQLRRPLPKLPENVKIV